MMQSLLTRASAVAAQVDLMLLVLLALSGFFVLLITGLVVGFGVRYRRGTAVDRSHPPTTNVKLEIAWMVIPLLLGLPVFVWSAHAFYENSRVPADALEIHVVAQQWMWKMQHPDGQREIDRLHVPANRPVKLLMISQDVIHSFWLPDFRIKQDVLPGRYTTLWFEATREGTYPLRCAEYCGAEHSRMLGEVVVMAPAAYQAWLGDQREGQSLAAQGQQLFVDLGCSSCHAQADDESRGPTLAGVYGSQVLLAGGQTVLADAAYLRESILQPSAKIVATYQDIMPPFAGQVSEEALLALISYIQSLQDEEEIE
ncbi:MAG: cytochrome c oxidase subunit II [Anaerolineales bacterium]|nr:cytochrome c oxidase subunit II [Anaerolineales bacterium]